MKKHQTVQVLTAGQMKDLSAAVVEAIPQNLSFEDAKYWIGNKGKLGKEIKRILFCKKDGEFVDLLLEWQNFWENITGKEYDFSNVVIPQKPEGKWRLLVIADIALETLYAKCKEKFSCWRWTNDNLDKIVTENERDAKNGPYAIWVKDEVEADENLKNKSANDIKAMGIFTETLAERLVHELKFFQETGNHLDIQNITLCAGSRDSAGGVPSVRWGESDGELVVGWDGPGFAVGDLRARVAVS